MVPITKKLSVIVDTGSSDLWIPDSKAICIPKWRGDRGDFCKNNGSYSPAASSTSKNLNTRFEIKYADGSYAKGNLYQDTVGIGGASVKNQLFANVWSTSAHKGILGIGFQANEATRTPYDNLPISLKNKALLLKMLIPSSLTLLKLLLGKLFLVVLTRPSTVAL